MYCKNILNALISVCGICKPNESLFLEVCLSYNLYSDPLHLSSRVVDLVATLQARTQPHSEMLLDLPLLQLCRASHCLPLEREPLKRDINEDRIYSEIRIGSHTFLYLVKQ